MAKGILLVHVDRTIPSMRELEVRARNAMLAENWNKKTINQLIRKCRVYQCHERRHKAKAQLRLSLQDTKYAPLLGGTRTEKMWTKNLKIIVINSILGNRHAN